ncbi:hypothetical protein ACLB1G_15935 [Oxalobacteraceae bacterium A2-2]
MRSMIAEAKDIQFDASKLSAANGVPELNVRGLIFHSAIVAENIKVVAEGDTRRILVEMAVTHPGKSGRFEVAIPLTPDIERVVFGQAGKELWSRTHAHTRRRSAGAHL